MASLAAVSFSFLPMSCSAKHCELQHRGTGHQHHPFVQTQYKSVVGQLQFLSLIWWNYTIVLCEDLTFNLLCIFFNFLHFHFQPTVGDGPGGNRFEEHPVVATLMTSLTTSQRFYYKEKYSMSILLRSGTYKDDRLHIELLTLTIVMS